MAADHTCRRMPTTANPGVDRTSERWSAPVWQAGPAPYVSRYHLRPRPEDRTDDHIRHHPPWRPAAPDDRQSTQDSHGHPNGRVGGDPVRHRAARGAPRAARGNPTNGFRPSHRVLLHRQLGDAAMAANDAHRGDSGLRGVRGRPRAIPRAEGDGTDPERHARDRVDHGRDLVRDDGPGVCGGDARVRDPDRAAAGRWSDPRPVLRGLGHLLQDRVPRPGLPGMHRGACPARGATGPGVGRSDGSTGGPLRAGRRRLAV